MNIPLPHDDADEVDYSWKPRSHVKVFSDRTLNTSGWTRRISTHTREGAIPCVIIAAHLNGEPVSKILIHAGENVRDVVRAIQLANAATTDSYREETGSIALADGAKFTISATRYWGRPGVSFQLVGSDGVPRGKPKSIFGEECEALFDAISAI